ncbi:TPR domain protein [Fusarium subglutinans]|uniref:TPR domain protein n=1 Tax=Gibberella subglutinans TaxID=42677 RepID=A0A8H5P504_GIBSU|nr:TPR domain protein [Fusarium subglutinans]KAF5590557.1 TPR domain protein [Fusarium subglutinans]
MEKLDQDILEATKNVQTKPGKDDIGLKSREELANLLITRYKQTGNTDDLRESLRHQMLLWRSLDIPTEGEASLWYMVIIGEALGSGIQYRYEETNDLEDLRAAITICWQVFYEDPSNAEHEAIRIRLPFDLRTGTLFLYQKSGNLGDIELAASYSRQVLPFIPDDVEDRANPLDEFARTLFKKYQVQQDPDILPVGIPLSRDTISWTPESHTEKPARIANLGAWLLRRYEKNGDTNDLLEAIEKTELAISLLDKNNFNQLRFLTNLGIMLFRQLELTWDKNDPEQVEIMASRADIGRGLQVNSIAHPLLGIEAARDVIRIFKFHGKLEEANSLAQKALQLLPMACHPTITGQDQQHAIQQMSRFAAEACSLSLLVEKPEEALLSIEFSCEIILYHLIKYGNRLSLLEQQSKDSAIRFDKLRSTAAQAVDTMDQVTIQDRIVPEMDDFAHDYDFGLALIRNLPDFKNFLSLPNIDDLVKGVTHGSVVIVNITPLSSDAIIILPSGERIRSLNLPKATPHGNSLLDKHSKAFNCIRKSQGLDIESDMDLYDEQFLSWLWTACVDPILKEIAWSPSSSSTPRVWWIGTGIASGFPFHAAGNSEASTLDNVISSYIPSITSLIEARGSITSSSDNGEGISVTLVTMPRDSDGCRPPDPTEMLRMMEETPGGTFKVETLSEPSLEEVLENLRRSHVIHFACHGYSNPLNPSQSYVQVRRRLSPGADDGKLTVELLSNKTTFDKAQIAFLSLYTPAEGKAKQSTDGGLDIISAFQLAGFRHVVGYLSNADGASNAHITKSFYESLKENVLGENTDYLVAKALHDALRSARDHDNDPHWWAPCIHSGP